VSDELPDYRPVNLLAVAALVVGVVSALVLFTPLAAMLPLVAIVLAVAALASIRQSEGRTVGRWPALAGLALATGFSAQAMATISLDRMVANHRAAATAVAWVNAIREGRFDDAIAMSSPAILPTAGRGHHELAVDMGTRRDAFAALPEIQALTRCGATMPRQSAVERTSQGWSVRFSTEPCGVQGLFVLAVTRQAVPAKGQAVEEWRVIGFHLER